MRKFLCKMLNNINKSLNIDEKFCEKSEKKLEEKEEALFPPLPLTSLTNLVLASLVLAAGLPFSKHLFF